MLSYKPSAAGELRPESLTAAEPKNRGSSEKWPNVVRVGALIAGDLLALITAFFVTCLAGSHRGLTLNYAELFPLLVFFPAVYAAAGLYPGFGLGAVETLRRLVHCTNASFLAVAACAFVFRAGPQYSATAFGLVWMAALVAVPLGRFGTLRIVKQLRWWGEPAVIFGETPEVALVVRALRNGFALGYTVVGILVTEPAVAPGDIEGIPVLGGLNVIGGLSRRGVGTALLWDCPDRPQILDSLHRQFHHVVLIRDSQAMTAEHIRVRNLGGVLGIELKSNLLNRRNILLKRILDVILGAALFVVSIPVMCFFAGLLQLVSPGPIFFSQEREGLDGSRFRLWKLRTMYPNSEQQLVKHLAADPELSRQWNRNVKLIRDPRVVPVVGHVMRRLSIDELPQFWSAVTGKMSLVGPRPFPEYHLRRFPPHFRQLRMTVRPGLTGMWQVMVRSDGSIVEQERYDTYYIRNWSLWLDIYLIVRTIFALVDGRGAR